MILFWTGALVYSHSHVKQANILLNIQLDIFELIIALKCRDMTLELRSMRLQYVHFKLWYIFIPYIFCWIFSKFTYSFYRSKHDNMLLFYLW